jgi:hypothetical protein
MGAGLALQPRGLLHALSASVAFLAKFIHVMRTAVIRGFDFEPPGPPDGRGASLSTLGEGKSPWC